MTARVACVAALAAILSAPLPAQQSVPPQGVDRSLIPYASTKNSVRLDDGRMLHLVCMGEGSPTVILTAGAGDWGIGWRWVQSAIAAKTRVCAWDRAGFGLSAPPARPQTVAETTTDLEAALRIGGIAGPYIAVGHSLGAYETLLLKDRQPTGVVGMVLVDPSIPDQAARFARVAPALTAYATGLGNPVADLMVKCAAALRAGTVRPGGEDSDGCLRAPPPPADYPAELVAAMPSPARASPQTIAAAMDTLAFYASPDFLAKNATLVVKADRTYGDMPLTVLTAAEFQAPPDFPPAAAAELPAREAEWQRGHNEYAALSTRGANRTVVGASHYIQRDDPQAVIDAIAQVVDTARADKS